MTPDTYDFLKRRYDQAREDHGYRYDLYPQWVRDAEVKLQAYDLNESDDSVPDSERRLP